MPVELKDDTATNRVNPALVNGEVYRIVHGYGKGRVFVVFQCGREEKGVQYLGSTGDNAWDLASTLDASQFVNITLQEV